MKLIKTIQSFVLLLMLAAGVAGCQKHNNITSDAWNGEICLSSEISSQVKTRVTNNDVPDKQIAANKIVSFFVDDAGVTGVAKKTLYENYLVQANGNGGFTKYGSPQAADMYYPATGNKVDIYAFLTNAFVSNQTFPASAITHSVMADQSTQHGANYLNSDLLYAANKAVARSSKPVQMNFYHFLSKVEVALKAGAGTPNLANAVVTIENTRLKANFLPDKSVDINDQSNGQSARAAMITSTANNSNPITPIKIGTSIETNGFGTATTYSSAVVVPQTVAKGSSFIKVTPMGGSPLYYTLPADLELKSGYKYQFQITVNLTGLTVTSAIADWATETPSSDIVAVIPPPPPIGSKGPAEAVVGDFYFSDGTLETGSITTLTTAQKAACVGIVYWVGDITGDDALLKRDHPSCIHGLVVALQDAGADIIAWSTNYEEVNAWTNAAERKDKQVNITVDNKMQGYSNTVALTAYNNESSNVQKNEKLKVLHIAAIAEYAKNHPAPANSSGWYWPSIMELKYMCWGQGNSSGTSGKELLNTQFNKVGGASSLGNDFFWSSSEYPNYSYYARYVFFLSGIVSHDDKNSGTNVRSILAF